MKEKIQYIIFAVFVILFSSNFVYSQNLYQIDSSNLFCLIDQEGNSSIYTQNSSGEFIKDSFLSVESWSKTNLKKYKRRSKKLKKKIKNAKGKSKKKLRKKRKKAVSQTKLYKRIIALNIECLNSNTTFLGEPIDISIPSNSYNPSPPSSSGGSYEIFNYYEVLGGGILASDNQFLGYINSNSFDRYSICNQFGIYGSKFSSTSILNEFSQYGGQFSFMSAFNPFTYTPPLIIYGSKVAYLTENEFIAGPRVDTSSLLYWLGCNL